MIHEVVRSFSSITIDYNSKAISQRGYSLPASTYEPTISIRDQMHDLLKSGLLQHSIDWLSTAPASWTYFKQSIERIPSAPTVKWSAVVPIANTALSNTPRGNGGRGIQRNNSNVVPTIVANETGWIKMIGRISSIRLPFLVGSIQLCKDYTIIGRVCPRQRSSCPRGIHSTFQQLS